MKILITGVAGFIGMHAAEALLKRGDDVVGIDNLNSYYDPQLKKDRISNLVEYKKFKFELLDVSDRDRIKKLFEHQKFDMILHLAGQAGVRYSIENPNSYVDSNLVGFMNVLEQCRQNGIKHFIYASSSSVYGNNEKIPFSESDAVDHPISLYAATKRANELFAYSYSHLYGIQTTGLRFFTVYGPWGRPDMALFEFTKNIINRKPLKIFNYGRHIRDFTYIDDLIRKILAIIDVKKIKHIDTEDNNKLMMYEIFNIGNGSPIELIDYVKAIEKSLKIEAIKEFLPMQPGDVLGTYADTKKILALETSNNTMPIENGIDNFVRWFKNYYKF
jgi:UDP-glucuronate 4-epimerase